jgi:hypothetical protein
MNEKSTSAIREALDALEGVVRGQILFKDEAKMLLKDARTELAALDSSRDADAAEIMRLQAELADTRDTKPKAGTPNFWHCDWCGRTWDNLAEIPGQHYPHVPENAPAPPLCGGQLRAAYYLDAPAAPEEETPDLWICDACDEWDFSHECFVHQLLDKSGLKILPCPGRLRAAKFLTVPAPEKRKRTDDA